MSFKTPNAVAPDAKEVFVELIDRVASDQWESRLNELCEGNESLRRRVEDLLHAHREAGSFLDPAATSIAVESAMKTTSHPPEPPGTQIGPYTLLHVIGEGGMGVVYLAEQHVPVERRVALKIIKPGMDSRQIIARFQAERQALALMDHPNIARVLDAGTTQSARPYFVMELVRGVPITQYCDDRQLSLRQRLELFVPVCQAVQHAHQKGIIHRDLKPSNVLVAEYDAQPVPKVIDFGLAKATAQGPNERTMFTQLGQVVGTLEYMSPEQARLNQLDIDTRTDIYSLGVLLYELLAGSTPFDAKRLRKAAFDETLRIIREEEPARPSNKLSSSESLPSIAAQRHTEPAKLTRLVRGELDWIVMKSLEKDRNRRYETANGLALDVQRYLADEPVQACPPAAWYRLQKLAKRNRAAFVGVLAAILVMLLGGAALVTSNILIRQEQARTKQEKVRAENAQKLAEGHAEKVKQGLERLKTANALLDRGRWYALERCWDDAHAAFTQAIQLHPDHVSVWVERGDLHTRLGLWDLAAADYAREIELREPDTTLRWFQHALLRRAIGDEEGCRQAGRAMRERFAGTTKERFVEETLRSSLLVPDQDAELVQLVELTREVVPAQRWSMPYVLATAHYRMGHHDEALQRLKDWADRPEWPIGRLSYPLQAMAHYRLGHTAKARQALDDAARVLDSWSQERYERAMTHPGADAVWPVAWWDFLECQLYYREAKLLIDGSAPPDDPRLHVLRARALARLDFVEQAAGEFAAAMQLAADDLRIRQEAHRNRGMCHVHNSQWRKAAAEFTAAAELHPDDAYLWRSRAVAHFAAGDFDAYRRTCTAMMERFAQTEEGGTAAGVLAASVLRDDALPDMAALLPLTRFSDPLGHWGTGVRGAALYRAGKFEECLQCFESSAKKYRLRPWDWCFMAMAQHKLGHAAEARRCLSEATRWIDAAKQHTDDDPTGTLPVWGGWHEPAVSPLLLAEAEQLLKTALGAKTSVTSVGTSGETTLEFEP